MKQVTWKESVQSNNGRSPCWWCCVERKNNDAERTRLTSLHVQFWVYLCKAEKFTSNNHTVTESAHMFGAYCLKSLSSFWNILRVLPLYEKQIRLSVKDNLFQPVCKWVDNKTVFTCSWTSATQSKNIDIEEGYFSSLSPVKPLATTGLNIHDVKYKCFQVYLGFTTCFREIWHQPCSLD